MLSVSTSGTRLDGTAASLQGEVATGSQLVAPSTGSRGVLPAAPPSTLSTALIQYPTDASGGQSAGSRSEAVRLRAVRSCRRTRNSSISWSTSSARSPSARRPSPWARSARDRCCASSLRTWAPSRTFRPHPPVGRHLGRAGADRDQPGVLDREGTETMTTETITSETSGAVDKKRRIALIASKGTLSTPPIHR